MNCLTNKDADPTTITEMTITLKKPFNDYSYVVIVDEKYDTEYQLPFENKYDKIFIWK